MTEKKILIYSIARRTKGFRRVPNLGLMHVQIAYSQLFSLRLHKIFSVETAQK